MLRNLRNRGPRMIGDQAYGKAGSHSTPARFLEFRSAFLRGTPLGEAMFDLRARRFARSVVQAEVLF